MSNPYAATNVPVGQFPPQFNGSQHATDGFVRQVPIVGILMILEGALETLMGGILIAVGIGFPYLAELSNSNANRELTPQMRWFILLFYCIWGGCTVLVALFRIFAGVQIYRYRNRILGIIANIFGFATVLTCYCSPFSVGIGVFGLIVLMQAGVVREFALRGATFKT